MRKNHIKMFIMYFIPTKHHYLHLEYTIYDLTGKWFLNNTISVLIYRFYMIRWTRRKSSRILINCWVELPKSHSLLGKYLSFQFWSAVMPNIDWMPKTSIIFTSNAVWQRTQMRHFFLKLMQSMIYCFNYKDLTIFNHLLIKVVI